MGLMFLGKPKTEVKQGAGEGPFLTVAMVLLSITMVFIGTQPNLVMSLFIEPAVAGAGFPDGGHLGHIHFFESSAVWDMLITLVIGALFFGFGMKTHLFHYVPPQWLSVEAAGKQIVRAYQWIDNGVSKAYGVFSVRLASGAQRSYVRMVEVSRKLDYEGGGIFTVLNFSNLNSNTFLILTVLALLVLYYLGVYGLRM